MRRKALVALLVAAVGVAAIGIVLTRDTGDVADQPQVAQPSTQPEVDRAVRNLMGTFGLTREEAQRYLELNGRVGDAREALEPHLPGVRLLGTWVEYTPEWKFVIALRGPAPPPESLSEAVAHAPVPVDIRLGPGSPEDQLLPILEAEVRERGGEGSLSNGTIHLVIPPPAGATVDEARALAAELQAELEAEHSVRFDVVLAYVIDVPLGENVRDTENIKATREPLWAKVASA